jgi:F420-non-reducing hydrogenase iron-sulfur subunit
MAAVSGRCFGNTRHLSISELVGDAPFPTLTVLEANVEVMDSNKNFRPKITIFHCINAFSDKRTSPLTSGDGFETHIVKLPCSSMVKDVYLLRAFEAGADAVVVLVCPERQCRHLEGNIRAKKRVERLKNLLDEIDFDSRRLSIFNLALGDEDAAAEIMQKILSELAELGPSPAK